VAGYDALYSGLFAAIPPRRYIPRCPTPGARHSVPRFQCP